MHCVCYFWFGVIWACVFFCVVYLAWYRWFGIFSLGLVLQVKGEPRAYDLQLEHPQEHTPEHPVIAEHRQLEHPIITQHQRGNRLNLSPDSGASGKHDYSLSGQVRGT